MYGPQFSWKDQFQRLLLWCTHHKRFAHKNITIIYQLELFFILLFCVDYFSKPAYSIQRNHIYFSAARQSK